VERRRSGQARQSPATTLQQMPALVVLERFAVPVVAIGQDGTILFANGAFADMLGYTPEALRSLTFHQIYPALPVGEPVVSTVREREELIVELVHVDGSIVRARMSKSALVRGGDLVALATFDDLTERLWVDGL
jgi:PAS domain S-box-containing protein